MKYTLTLDEQADLRNFTCGLPLHVEHGRVLRGWILRWYLLRSRARHMTRWWRPRTVVTAVDVVAGSITVGDERWSWRRWRWGSGE